MQQEEEKRSARKTRDGGSTLRQRRPPSSPVENATESASPASDSSATPDDADSESETDQRMTAAQNSAMVSRDRRTSTSTTDMISFHFMTYISKWNRLTRLKTFNLVVASQKLCYLTSYTVVASQKLCYLTSYTEVTEWVGVNYLYNITDNIETSALTMWSPVCTGKPAGMEPRRHRMASAFQRSTAELPVAYCWDFCNKMKKKKKKGLTL